MSLYELNAKAWDKADPYESQKTMVIVGNLKWPSKQAFDEALKELYDSLKAYERHKHN
jgi:hypothetical protein